MKIELTNDEVKTIVTALVKMPWIDVNDVINKLTEPPSKPEMLTLPVVEMSHAPYGLKKDGTPAKRRGRPAVKKTRKVRQ